MEISPALIIVMIGSVGTLLVERFFYYRSKYKDKKTEKVPIPPDPVKIENPSHGERIATLEEAVDNMEKNNEKDHRLIRGDIRKLFSLLNGMRRPGK